MEPKIHPEILFDAAKAERRKAEIDEHNKAVDNKAFYMRISAWVLSLLTLWGFASIFSIGVNNKLYGEIVQKILFDFGGQ